MANILIIGAGASGLFAAGTALSQGHKVTVVEHSASPGKKLLITGKGRCNLTNNCTRDEFFQNVRRNDRFLYSCFGGLNAQDVMNLFEYELGVKLKTERGGRVFPESDNAHEILNALLSYANGADIIYDNVKSLIIENDVCKGAKLDKHGAFYADSVFVATGGLSYQVTGSTGDGYRFAKQAGHNVVTPEPSLVSLVERGNIAKSMMGLSLKNITLTLVENGKEVFNEMGEMLFTHFGVSGPLVLSASAHLRDVKNGNCKILIDLKPALSAQQLDARILKDFALMQSKETANCLQKLLPSKMQPVMLKLWGIDQTKKVNQITKEERQKLIELLKAFEIEIKEKGDLAHAVITSGGVDVKEINPKTMESRLVKGLCFIGEVLDIDAYTGGFNLQIAFSTAYAAAKNVG